MRGCPERARDDPSSPSCSVAERDIALPVLQMLVEAHAMPAVAQNAGERRLAHLDRLPAHVGAVQLQQVERIQERTRLVLTAAQGGRPSN